MNTLRQKKMVDKLIDAYVGWREACGRVSEAYGWWASDMGPGAPSAFARYMEALAREERAADVYAELVRRVDQLVSSKQHAVEPLGGWAWGVSSR